MVNPTITLRARWLGADPVPGTFMAAAKGPTVYRIVSATRIHTAGDPNSYRYRLVCERLAAGALPDGAEVLPWAWDSRAPRPGRRGARARHTADPGPPEPGRARIARIRAKAPLLLGMAVAAIRAGRVADEVARLARAARVGHDDGVAHGRDHGPSIRARTIRGRRNEIIRAADVEIEEGPDPARPNRTVRRARRADPLLRLKRAGTINHRHVDAAERLREQMEAAEASMPGGGDALHVPGHQRGGFSDWQINNQTLVREAVARVAPLNRGAVLWVAVGGSVSGFASFAHVDHNLASGRLSAGLEQLATHYYGAEARRP